TSPTAQPGRAPLLPSAAVSSLLSPGSSPDGAPGGPSTTPAPPDQLSTGAAASPAASGSSLPKSALAGHRTPLGPAAARKKPAPLGGSEIVDPWGKGKAR
ncbi:MAG TPA: hypothetical protein VGL19_02755, partial [Polyangiaceae bacterium]